MALRALAVVTVCLACRNDPAIEAPVLEGRLETVVVEGPQGGTRHFLIPDDGADPIELDFDVDPSLGSGARIAVNGRFEGARFRVIAFEEVRQSALAGVTPERTRTVAFVMVDYGMGVNQQRANVERFMFSTTQAGPTLGIGANDRSVLQFYDETSYGLFNVTGGIEGPFSWTGGAACNGSGGSQLASMLRGMLSMTYGHNIWYYGSKQSACEYGWGSLGNWNTPSSNVWFNGALFDGAIAHEIGHNLGYQHASSIKCSGMPLANDPLTCTTTEYGSAISIMGNTSNGHMMALEKWYAGWFKGCNAVRVRSTGTFNLLPIENACGGVQALQIPMPVTNRQFDPAQTTTAPIRYYYLEYRNGTALDTGIPAAVYVVASDEIAAPNRACARSVQMDMTPSSTRLDGMTAGQSFTDPAGGVTFSVMSLTPSAAVVNVMIDGAGSANTCMDGSTLGGMGPTTCTAGPGGATGTGGAGGGGSGGTGGGAAGRGGAGGTTGGAGRGGTTGAAGTTGTAGRGGTTGAAGMSGSAGSAGTTGAGGQSGTAGAGGSGAGAGTVGSGGTGVITAGTTGSTGVGGTTGGTTPGTGGGAGGPPTSGTDAGPPGAGQESAGCACELGAAPSSNNYALAIALALAGVGLGRRRPRRRLPRTS